MLCIVVDLFALCHILNWIAVVVSYLIFVLFSFVLGASERDSFDGKPSQATKSH